MTEPDVNGFLQEAAGRSGGDEVSLPIREFIAHWGAKRRGYSIIKQINSDLAEHGLQTIPSFETGWIDNHIRLVPIGATNGNAQDEDSDDGELNQQPSELRTALRVGTLKSADRELTAVAREDSLSKAQSLMCRGDYSQLPILAGKRNLYGAVSWESIAKARMHKAIATLADCIVEADLVGLDDELLGHIPRIIDRGYVFVKNPTREICGIVTTADLSSEFHMLAGPFLLVGEAERHLRRIADAAFTKSELGAVRDPNDNSRDVNSAEDLTLGEYVRLFEPRETWERLGWDIDRQVFIAALTDLRDLRNEIMHFSPDPIEEERVDDVRHLLKWLKLLEPDRGSREPEAPIDAAQ